MKLWKALYAMIWLVFFQIIVILLPRFTPYLVGVHLILGFAILGLAHYDNITIRKTPAPDRLKRIVKSTAILATIQPILGIILLVNLMLKSELPLIEVVSFIHLVIALAIITQAASAATAYDMWEEHEFPTSPPAGPKPIAS